MPFARQDSRDEDKRPPQNKEREGMFPTDIEINPWGEKKKQNMTPKSRKARRDLGESRKSD